MRSVHLVISAEYWLGEECELFAFGGENFGLIEIDATALRSSIFLSSFVFSISSYYFIAVSILLMLAVIILSRRVS